MKTNYGIQMYSLRDITQNDLMESLEFVAEVGYKYVEFAGFFGHSGDDVKEKLDSLGLICSSTHTAITDINDKNIRDVIEYHHKIGCNNIVIPGADWSTEELMEENIALFNRAIPLLNSEGISLSYHNHSNEYIVTQYGKLLHTRIEERCPEMKLELDTFWLYNAGVDPICEMERLRSRLSAIHLKDGIAASEGKPAEGRSVGEGEAPVKDIIKKANELGVLMIVESEDLNPSGKEEVTRCIDYLKKLD